MVSSAEQLMELYKLRENVSETARRIFKRETGKLLTINYWNMLECSTGFFQSLYEKRWMFAEIWLKVHQEAVAVVLSSELFRDMTEGKDSYANRKLYSQADTRSQAAKEEYFKELKKFQLTLVKDRVKNNDLETTC